MTPKEKSIELVNKFQQLKPVKMSDYSRIYFPTAKLCALIAVNEIFNSVDDEHVSDIFNEYWEEVKTEIEKL
jgi:hypothetical protein